MLSYFPSSTSLLPLRMSSGLQKASTYCFTSSNLCFQKALAPGLSFKCVSSSTVACWGLVRDCPKAKDGWFIANGCCLSGECIKAELRARRSLCFHHMLFLRALNLSANPQDHPAIKTAPEMLRAKRNLFIISYLLL